MMRKCTTRPYCEKTFRLDKAFESWDHKGRVTRRFPESAGALYEDLRDKWKHEDNLINQRVTWLLTYQIFSFGAFGLIANFRFGHDKCAEMKPVVHLWQILSPYSIGEVIVVACSLAVAYFVADGIKAAIRAMKIIKCRLKFHQRARRIWSGLRVDVLQNTTHQGARPAIIMAYTFWGAWLLIALYELSRLVLPFFFPFIPIV